MLITKENLKACLREVPPLFRTAKMPVHAAWLAGSAARIYFGKHTTQTNDLDVFVEGPRWNDDRLKPLGVPYKKTGFGDYKLTLPSGLVIDLMFGHLGKYMRQVPTAWDGIVVNVFNETILTTTEFWSPTNFEIITRATRKPDYLPYYIDHLRKQGIPISA